MKKIYEHKLFLLLFSLIYISNDTLLFGINSSNHFMYIQYAFILTTALILTFIILINKKIKYTPTLIFVILILLLIITMIIKDTLSLKYFYEILLLYIGLLLCNIYSLKQFCREFVNVIFIMAILSFIPFLINIFFNQLLNYFPTAITTTQFKFHNLIFSVVPYNTYTFNTYRNYSIFREPGVYASFLNLGLLLLLFSKDKDKYFIEKIAVFFIATITTLSSGGIITSVLALVLFTLIEKFSTKKMILIIISLIASIILLKSDYINNAVFNKFHSNNGSLYSRQASIISNLKIGFYNPILGVGWESLEDEFETESTKIFGSAITHGESLYHNTNTFFKILAMHGFIFFLIYSIGIFKAIYNLNKNKLFSFLGIIILIISLSYEDLTLNFITYLLMFYGYIHNNDIERSETSDNC